MNKEKLLSDLNQEAKRLVKKRIIIIRLILSLVIVILCWYWNMFDPSSSSKLWQMLFVSILFLSLFIAPLWRITPEKIRYTFYEVTNRRAQECTNEIKNISLEEPSISAKLAALEEKNDLFSEILKENLKQMQADVA